MKKLFKTKNFFVFVFVTFMLSMMIISCGEEDSDNGTESTDTSTFTAKLRGSNIGSTSASSSRSQNDFAKVASPTTTGNPVSCKAFFVLGEKASDGSQCGGRTPCYPNAGQKSGSCVTPLSVTGKANIGKLLGSNTPGGLRLIGTGIEGGGKDDIFLIGEAFDIANPVAMTGVNNLEDHKDFDSQHTSMSLNFDYLDVKLAVPRTVNSASVTRFWTIRYIFVSLPFTSDTVNSCTTTCSDAAELDCNTTCTATSETVGQCLDRLHHSGADSTANTKAADYFGGLSGVKKGDILLCEKETADATCGSSDWKWMNTSLNNNDGGLVSSRPSTENNIWKFKHIADHKSTCQENSDGVGVNTNLGGWGFNLPLYSAIKFNASYNRSLKVYKFADSSGSIQEGSNLEMYVDVDIKNSVLLYDAVDNGSVNLTFSNLGNDFSNLRSLSDAQLLKKIWYKPVFAYEYSGCDPWKPGSCENIPTGLKANIKIALSGATEPPIYQCEASKGDDSTDCVGNEEPGSQ